MWCWCLGKKGQGGTARKGVKGVRVEDGRGHQKVGRNGGDLKWKQRRWIGGVRFSGLFWIGIVFDVALANLA